MNRTSRVVITFVGLQAAYSGLSRACSCMPIEASTAELLDDYPMVFVGEAGRTRKELRGCNSSARIGHTRFEVVGAFKGVEQGEQVVIEHVLMGASCGLEFEPGESYLLFTDGSTNLCAPGGPVDAWQDDIEELRTLTGE